MTQTLLVPTEHVHQWWPLVSPFLQPAVDITKGRWSMSALLDMIQDDQASLWICHHPEHKLEAALVTQVVEYPTGKLMLSVLFLGGEGLPSFLPSVVEKLVSFALYRGASGIELQGRPGWVRSLAPYGVKPNGTQLIEVHFGGIGNQSDNRATS